MDYYCEKCDKNIKLQSKNRHFKPTLHKEFDRCEHIKLRIENPNLNDIDETFYAYIIEHKKNYDYFPMKCVCKLVFFDNQQCPYVMSEIYSNKTMCFWYRFLENVNIDFKDEGYNFNIADVNIIAIVNKRHMSYDFCIKHIMCAL